MWVPGWRGSLLRNGFDLTVRDLDRSVAQPFLDAGAAWGDSPQAMAESCDVVYHVPAEPRCERRGAGGR